MIERILKLENGSEFRKVNGVWVRYWGNGSSSNLDTENFRDVFRLLENALKKAEKRQELRDAAIVKVTHRLICAKASLATSVPSLEEVETEMARLGLSEITAALDGEVEG